MSTSKRAVRLFPAALAMLLIPVTPLHAEEGGSGHYAPGGAAAFIDAFPGKPGAFFTMGIYNYYSGNAEASVEIPNAGLITFGLDATAHSATVVAFGETKLVVLGGNLAFGAAVPIVWLDARAQVESGLVTGEVKDSARGVADVSVYPFMLGWVKQGGDLKYDVRIPVYIPTGSFEKGSLANLGRNYWTFEPGFCISYFGSKNGREATAYAAFDINTKNTDTDYQTGTQFHLDLTLAQHFPLLGGIVGIGANGFVYQQLADDSGSGAVIEDFKGRTAGAGPTLSYIKPMEKSNLAFEVKWLPELDVDKRLEGDYIWAKLACTF